MIHETADQWGILKDLIAESGLAGNLVTDAYLASMVIANGAILVSCDMDFARFAKLRWENPSRAGLDHNSGRC